MQRQYQNRQRYVHENGVEPTEDDEIEYQMALIGRAMSVSASEENPLPSIRPVQESAIKGLVGD